MIMANLLSTICPLLRSNIFFPKPPPENSGGFGKKYSVEILKTLGLLIKVCALGDALKIVPQSAAAGAIFEKSVVAFVHYSVEIS